MADKYFVDGDGGQSRLINGEMAARPSISTSLDSVRAYQWEVTFHFPSPFTGADKIGNQNKPLTLAAKQVNGLGFSVEDIEVNRVNDKVYYPGRVSYEEAVITFDNLAQAKVDKLLYEVMSKTFNPRTGVLGAVGAAGGAQGNVKGEIQLVQLNADGTPRNIIRLMGAYAKNLTHGEYNYSTNEFHTLEMTFRYDNFITTVDGKGLGAVNGNLEAE